VVASCILADRPFSAEDVIALQQDAIDLRSLVKAKSAKNSGYDDRQWECALSTVFAEIASKQVAALWIL